jgi:glycosyltransferase involved in cell wall biosynthesis
MKVLLVSDYAPRFGGAEQLLFRFRDMLCQRGHDARVFTSSAGGPAGADYTCAGTLGPFRTLLQSANPDAALRLRRVLREFRPDVVTVKLFLTQLSPLILPVLRDVPSVYHAVWYRAVCPIGTKLLPDRTPCREPHGVACLRNGCVPARDWLPLAAQMALLRRWRPVFRRVVANSEATRAALESGGIAPVDVITNGVPVLAQRPRLAGPPVAAFAGRLVPEKGADVLVRAFARVHAALPHARLLIAGDGPERGRLLRLIAELGLERSVALPGHLPRATLDQQLDAAWVQAVPSVWAEPFGFTTAEAMMRGTAVIATATGASPTMVEGERTGVLVPALDEERLAAALLRLLTDRDLAERMGAAGRKRALAEFSDERFTDRFLALLESIRS